MERASARAGFSIVELLVVGVIVLLLAAIALPLLARSRAAAREVACLSNVRQIAEAFHVYAAANGEHLPDDMGEKAWDELLEPHLRGGFAVFGCPADDLETAAPLSYGWRESFEVFDPGASLAGRRLSEVKDTGLVMVFEDVSGRHREGARTAASVDTSARSWGEDEFEANLQKPVW